MPTTGQVIEVKPPKGDTIRDCWLEYIAAVYQGELEPGTDQYNQLEQCFYAACHAFLNLMIRHPADDKMTEDQGVAWLEARRREIFAHAKTVLMRASARLKARKERGNG